MNLCNGNKRRRSQIIKLQRHNARLKIVKETGYLNEIINRIPAIEFIIDERNFSFAQAKMSHAQRREHEIIHIHI